MCCVCECVYRISFTNFGAFKYEPRYEFGHLKLRRCLGLRADGWLNGRAEGGTRGEGRGEQWQRGTVGASDGCLSGLLLDRCLVCCCCCSQLLSLSTCFTPLWRGVTRSREATTATPAATTTSWRQPQLCLRQRHAANDPFNGPLHKMPPQPSLAQLRAAQPWSALVCLGAPLLALGLG